jgi:hypothetical protein
MFCQVSLSRSGIMGSWVIGAEKENFYDARSFWVCWSLSSRRRFSRKRGRTYWPGLQGLIPGFVLTVGRENDPDRNLATSFDRPSRWPTPSPWLSSLKVYLWAGASVNPNRTTSHPRRSRVLSFYRKIDVYLPIGTLQMSAPIQNTSARIARISDNDTDSPLEAAKLLNWIPIASGPRLRSSKLYPELRSAPLRIQS